MIQQEAARKTDMQNSFVVFCKTKIQYRMWSKLFSNMNYFYKTSDGKNQFSFS